MKNIFKEIRTRYFEFLDYRDESQECFINRKGEIVAIVDMCSLLQYWFYNTFFIKTNDIEFGKEDYFRLYPKKAKRLTFVNYRDSSTDSKDCWTLKDVLGLNEDDNCYTMRDILNKMGKITI